MADGRDSDSVCGTEAGSDASVVDAGDAVDTETRSHARGACGADRRCWASAIGDACEAYYKDGLWVPAKVLGATEKGKYVDVRYDKSEPPIDCRSIYYPMQVRGDSLGAIANRFGVRRVEMLMEANRELFTARLGTTAPQNVMVHKLTKLIIPHVHRARAGETPQVVAPRAPHTLPPHLSAESQPTPRRPSQRFTCPRASWARRSTRHGSRRS